MYMRKFILFFALMMAATTMFAANKGIPSEILKDGKAKYLKSTNTLVLEEGFLFRQGKGLVVFNTGKDLRILLKGNAEFRAALDFKDKVIMDSEGDYKLSVTSNISGSALKCPALIVNKNVKLELISRNSQDGMYALDCKDITVNGGTILADVTTAYMAVKTMQLNLNGSWLEKPKGGIVDAEKGCICFGDSLPAKRVRITPEVKK